MKIYDYKEIHNLKNFADVIDNVIRLEPSAIKPTGNGANIASEQILRLIEQRKITQASSPVGISTATEFSPIII